MSYKNTVKIFASNFMLVWKQLLYLFICGLIFALCTYATIEPIIALLRSNQIFIEVKHMVESAYSSPSAFALTLSEFCKHFSSVIFSHFSEIWLHLIALIIFAILLPYLLIQMSYYNICSIIYQKISMNMNVGYIQNGMRKFKQSLIYALSSILFNLPFWALSILFVVLYLTLAKTIVSAIVGLSFLILLLILQKSIKFALFACYTGYMVKNDASSFVSFGKGTAMVIKTFGRVFSNAIVLMLTIILINGFIMIFTFFSGLILSVPATFVFVATFYMVTFCNAGEERYYLNTNFIYNPSRYQISSSVQAEQLKQEEIRAQEQRHIEVMERAQRKRLKKSKTEQQSHKTFKSAATSAEAEPQSAEHNATGTSQEQTALNKSSANTGSAEKVKESKHTKS